MKRLVSTLAALFLCTAVSVAAPKSRTFRGEIMDSQCATMGSHDQMMQKFGAKDAKECTLKCAGMGGKFVLYTAAKKATYQLDDQEKPKEFAGQKVKVTGSYDRATKTIHVESIEPGA